MYSRAIFWDIRIFGQNEEVVASIRDSFSTANIFSITAPVPNVLNDSPGVMIGGIPQSDARIFVGPKRPPN